MLIRMRKSGVHWKMGEKVEFEGIAQGRERGWTSRLADSSVPQGGVGRSGGWLKCERGLTAEQESGERVEQWSVGLSGGREK
jgi:hypothetical protein